MDLKRKLDAAVAEAKAVAEAPPKPTDADAKLKLLREEHARLATSTASLRQRAEERAKEAADAATAAERERGEEKTKRLAREVKRKEELIESHDARVDALRAELAAARDDVTRVSARLAAADATTRNESVAARRAANATLTGVRALAARLLSPLRRRRAHRRAQRLARSDRRGPVEAGIAATSSISNRTRWPISSAPTAGKDPYTRCPAGKESLRLGRASSPESFAALVAAVEMKADEVAASLVRGDGARVGEGTSRRRRGVAAASSNALARRRFRFKFRGGVSALDRSRAEAEAEHAEAANVANGVGPRWQDWWIVALSESGTADASARQKGASRAPRTEKEQGRGRGRARSSRAPPRSSPRRTRANRRDRKQSPNGGAEGRGSPKKYEEHGASGERAAVASNARGRYTGIDIRLEKRERGEVHDVCGGSRGCEGAGPAVAWIPTRARRAVSFGGVVPRSRS